MEFEEMLMPFFFISEIKNPWKHTANWFRRGDIITEAAAAVELLSGRSR
jgi:hypothetical protein